MMLILSCLVREFHVHVDIRPRKIQHWHVGAGTFIVPNLYVREPLVSR